MYLLTKIKQQIKELEKLESGFTTENEIGHWQGKMSAYLDIVEMLTPITPKYKEEQKVYQLVYLPYSESWAIEERRVVAANIRIGKTYQEITYELATPTWSVIPKPVHESYIYPTKEEAEKEVEKYLNDKAKEMGIE